MGFSNYAIEQNFWNNVKKSPAKPKFDEKEFCDAKEKKAETPYVSITAPTSVTTTTTTATRTSSRNSCRSLVAENVVNKRNGHSEKSNSPASSVKSEKFTDELPGR